METTFRQLRKRADLKTETASSLLGISKQMLYKIEQGARQPSIEVIKKIKTTYKCSYEEIFSALEVTKSTKNRAV